VLRPSGGGCAGGSGGGGGLSALRPDGGAPGGFEVPGLLPGAPLGPGEVSERASPELEPLPFPLPEPEPEPFPVPFPEPPPEPGFTW
jgi:hypothetical protein